MTPTLTRRDAVAALAAGLGGGAAAAGVGVLTDDEDDDEFTERDLATLVAVADVVYPTDVTGTAEFVRTYVTGLPSERRVAIARAVDRLDEGARRHAGAAFASLPPDKREAVLDRLGVSRAASDPSGAVPERIRYHLVNSLLYALFTSPTGSELVGIRNPTGHPGGYESLMRAPEGADD